TGHVCPGTTPPRRACSIRRASSDRDAVRRRSCPRLLCPASLTAPHLPIIPATRSFRKSALLPSPPPTAIIHPPSPCSCQVKSLVAHAVAREVGGHGIE